MIFPILIIGLLLRLVSLNQSLWLDEAINVLATKNFAFLGMITEYAKADFHPPAFFMIIWVWTRLFGISEIAVRIPSVIFGVITIYVIYLIGQKLHSKKLGLIAALLLAVNPLHIYYSQEARMYALACLVVSINIFLFIRLIKREKVSFTFLTASNILILLSDYVASFIFLAQSFFLLTNKREIFKKWFLSLGLAILLSSWWIPTFLNQFNIGTVTSSQLPSWKMIVGGFDTKAVPLTFIKFIIGRISYPDKQLYFLILLPVTLLFLFLIYRGIKFIKNTERNLLISWVVLPIILATAISPVIPIYSYFRLLFTLPAFILLISLGIFSIKAKLKYAFLILVFLVEIFSSFVYLYNPLYQRENWKGLVNFLRSQKNSIVLFESTGTLPPFEYYDKGQINAKGALISFPINSESEVIELTDYQNLKIFLVDYLVEVSDPQRLVSKKIINLGYKLIGTRDFTGIGFVYQYDK